MKTATACCQNPENHLVLHRSFRSVLPSFLFAIVAAIAVYWISARYSVYGVSLPLPSNQKIVLPFFLLISLVFFIRPIFQLLDCRHEITCHHIRSVQGRFSLNRQFVEIPFEEVLGVRTNQSLIDRVLEVGSIIVWTATAERPDLIMKGIGAPETYARMIGAKIDARIVENQDKS